MFLRGRGIKAHLQTLVTSVIKRVFPVGTFYNAPRNIITASDYVGSVKTNSSNRIVPIYESSERIENPPEILNHPVSRRFTRYYRRKVPSAFILVLHKGKIYGEETNYIITHSSHLLADISREFGMYGGKPMDQSNLIKRTLKLPSVSRLPGKIAVVTTSGANNFHHWNYDCIPRLHLLRVAGLLNEIDLFVISYKGLPFQKESLRLLGIPVEKIINPYRQAVKLFQADILFVPSLPSNLGTVSPWVVDFLRSLYNPSNEKRILFKRIYLSRKNVTSRKIINNDQFNSLLREFDVEEVFPEDYSVSEMARILAGAEFIISVHGSGLSNLCFISEATTVVDILAPYHQDGYYWMISNIRKSKYIGFFGEGDHPTDDLDLVRQKIDKDIYLDITKMRSLFVHELIAG